MIIYKSQQEDVFLLLGTDRRNGINSEELSRTREHESRFRRIMHRHELFSH